MPANRASPLRQPPLPPRARADRRRLIEQPVFFLLPGQSGELGQERIPGWEERFLAVEDGGIGALGVVEAVELPRAERKLDAAEQGRGRVSLDVGTDQVRDLPRMPVQLDQVRPLDLAQVRPGAALVNPQQRLERIERFAMNLEGVRQELSDRGTLGGLVTAPALPEQKRMVASRWTTPENASVCRTDAERKRRHPHDPQIAHRGEP